MSFHTTKLTLAISLVLFGGLADLVFGQSRSRTNQQTQQQSTTQQRGARQPVLQVGPQQRVLIISAGRLHDAPNFGGLNGADFDADALAHAFEKTGIPRKNIVFQSGNGWTQEAVQERLNEMGASSRPGDSLIVMLIGKTVQKQGLHYFCAADTTDAAITGGVNTGLVRISALAEQISGYAATHKALILDLVGKDGFPDFSNLEPQGLWFLTSATAREKSLREGGLVPGSREVRGVFNYYLTQGLLGMADLIGNNDGSVSFNELANYATQNTRAYAERAETRQTPQMLGTMVQQVGKVESVFNIGQKKEDTLVTNRNVFDEDHLTKSLSNYLALVGNAIVMSAQADLRKAFEDTNERSIKSIGQENADSVDVTVYLKRQGDANVFANANFLRPSLNDPENKMARLAIATASRAFGDYDDALRNYNDAGELFELYIVDRLGTWEKGEGEEAQDQISPFSLFNNDLTIEYVPLRSEASVTARIVRELPRGVKVFVRDFTKGKSGQPNDDWIKVRVYPSTEPDYVEGWIHRDYIYWSPEAAEWYTPLDGLALMYAGNAERFRTRAEALIRDAQARENRGARIRGITSVVGQFVPYGGYVQMGGQAAAAVAFSRAAAQRGAAMGAWTSYLHWQSVGEEHRAQLKTVGDQSTYFEGARIIIDPNDLPF